MALDNPILDGREGFARVVMPAKDLVKLTKGGGVIAETRTILIGNAGTINVVTSTGKTRNAVPVIAGVFPLRITELLAGGTATDIWGMY